jgi:hypothetical protein
VQLCCRRPAAVSTPAGTAQAQKKTVDGLAICAPSSAQSVSGDPLDPPSGVSLHANIGQRHQTPPSAASASVVCGNDLVAQPAFGHFADGKLLDNGGHQLLWRASKRAWYVNDGKLAVELAASGARRAPRVQQVEPCGCGGGPGAHPPSPNPVPGPPPPPSGSTLGSDGNYYNGLGQTILLSQDPDTGAYSWLPVIGTVTANPAYDPALQPYIDAANFGNNLAPWFYAFAMPIDIPVGSLATNLGARVLGRFAAKQLGRFIAMVSGATNGEYSTLTSAAINDILAQLGFSEPAFQAQTQVLDFFASDGFNQAFSGTDQLVRVTTNPGTLTGDWWMPLSQITNSDGSLMSAAEIQQLYALPSTPTNIIYGGQASQGSELFVGLSGPNGFSPNGGGGLQIYVRSGSITGTQNVPLP